MILASRALRILLLIACLVILAGIIPISVRHFNLGNTCPTLGPIPACYVVSVAYAAMAAAALVWWRNLKWLFFLGAAPVILLAATGTTLELSGVPTCPRSAGGWPLCYTSLMIGVSLLTLYLVVLRVERRSRVI